MSGRPARIVSTPGHVGGDARFEGTRVSVMVIVVQLRAGLSVREIFKHYPSLPPDGVNATKRWADATLGPDWRTSARVGRMLREGAPAPGSLKAARRATEPETA